MIHVRSPLLLVADTVCSRHRPGEKLFSTIQSMVGSDDMAEVNEPGAGWMLTDDLEHEVLGLRTVKRAR